MTDLRCDLYCEECEFHVSVNGSEYAGEIMDEHVEERHPKCHDCFDAAATHRLPDGDTYCEPCLMTLVSEARIVPAGS
jgi:hypothetical protein